MTRPKGGLGRGLAALIPTGPTTTTVTDVFLSGPPESAAEGESSADANAAGAAPGPASDTPALELSDGVAHPDRSSGRDGKPRYAELPLEDIRPNPQNPRTVFDEEALDELVHSIREFGLLQPVVVRPSQDGYELVMGERRWRAAQKAGSRTIPAIIRRTEDEAMLRDALLENIHRANLNPLEEAAAYQQLLDEFDVTHDQLAARIGRSRPVISNTIRLMKLPVVVQRRVAAGVLSAGHARALLGLEDAGEQEDLAARIVAEGLSVRGTEEQVVLMSGRKNGKRRPAPPKPDSTDADLIATRLGDRLDTHVKAEVSRHKGRLTVEFAGLDDLRRIAALLLRD